MCAMLEGKLSLSLYCCQFSRGDSFRPRKLKIVKPPFDVFSPPRNPNHVFPECFLDGKVGAQHFDKNHPSMLPRRKLNNKPSSCSVGYGEYFKCPMFGGGKKILFHENGKSMKSV